VVVFIAGLVLDLAPPYCALWNRCKNFMIWLDLLTLITRNFRTQKHPHENAATPLPANETIVLPAATNNPIGWIIIYIPHIDRAL